MINRRKFLKTSLSALAFAAIPKISFSQSNPDVVVIGGGSSGLSVTAELMKKGKSVLCVDAMSRKGGRCFTNTSIFGVPYDLGAHWLHNFNFNQIAQYGKKQKDIFDIYKDPDTVMVYDGQKKIKGMKLYGLYKKLGKLKNKTKDDIPLSNKIKEKWLENEWFATAHQIRFPCESGKDIDQYTAADGKLNWESYGEGSQGGDGFVKQGYGALLAHYRQNVPVQLQTTVNEVKWDGNGVKVVTNKGTISAKACVITVSTSAFNSGKIKFTPALPIEKYEAYDAFSCSNYNHITLQLTDDFYREYKVKPDMYFTTKIGTKGLKSPEGYCSTMSLHGSNISYFDVGGEFAKDLEKAGSKAGIDFVLQTLRDTFGSEFDKFYIKGHMTSWGKNPFVLGAWASATPGKAKLRRNIKNPVGNKLFFAGEATAKNYGTVHGADRSGLRAAKEVLKII